jgi:calcium-dependent protein kinase
MLIIIDNFSFCEEGELFKLIKKEPNGLPEITVAHIMNQLLSVVNYCHQAHNVVNRDYRLENILVDSVEYNYINNQNVPLFSIKVSEFKSARSFKNSKMLNKKVGNPYYIAPEVLKRKYNEKCDLWSCGIVMYILLTSKPPFSGTTDKEVLDKVQSGVFDYLGM